MKRTKLGRFSKGCKMPRSWVKRHATILSKRYQLSGGPNWKGGKVFHQGYVLILVNGKYVQEHRIIMEKSLGRPLRPSEIVDHKNHIRSDNRIENLEVMNWKKHHSVHAKQQVFKRAKNGCFH